MNKIIRTLAVAAMIGAAALSMAQGGGGRGMRMGGPGGGGPTMLLMREDVQKEIKLTSEQKSKLDEMRQAMQEKMREMFQNGGGGGDREAMMAEMQKMRAESDKQTNAVLTADQQKRLKELWIQREGARSITNADVQKDLNMTDDQKAKVKEIMAAQAEAQQGLMEKMRNQEIDRDEMRTIMTKNQETLKEKLNGVLTDEQKAQLKKMEGAPFKFEEGNGGIG
ncbi:MAG: hypothetical protein JST30_07895 [Armatimonadetes bacterium]|nr:hypothetical protein [Armatimonadota bacterium]